MKPNLNHVSAMKLLHLIAIINFLLPSDDDAPIRFTPSNGHQKHFITCDKAYEVRSRQIRTFKASLVIRSSDGGIEVLPAADWDGHGRTQICSLQNISPLGRHLVQHALQCHQLHLLFQAALLGV